jgi:hypothetical protein
MRLSTQKAPGADRANRGPEAGKETQVTDLKQSIAERTGRVEDREGTVVEIPSLTKAGVTYRIDLSTGVCDCPRNTHGGRRCVAGSKHHTVAEALLRERSRKHPSKVAEEEIVRLCREVFRPMKRGETPADAYRLFLEVRAYPHSSPGMVAAASRRHLRLLALCYGEEAA